MVKKFGIHVTICTLLFIFILNIFEKEAKETNDFDLNKMNEVMVKHNGKMTEWSIFAREELPQENLQELEKMFSRLQTQFPQFSWTKEIDSNRIMINGTVSNKSLHYVENLQIVANLNVQNTIQGFIMYEVKGTKWNNDVENEIKGKLNRLSTELFQKTTEFFSCIKGEFDGKIDGVITKKLINDFDGKIIEKLEEKDFKSLTVHSPYFSNELHSENGTFNMQIALREDCINNKTLVLIGTPILMVEY